MLGRGSAMKAKAGKPACREDPVNAKMASLVDIEWVAERLGVSVRYVRRLVDEKAIPFVKVRHLLRFDPTEIEAWIDGKRRPVANEHG
jgi:excisionase family DNA binding protein